MELTEFSSNYSKLISGNEFTAFSFNESTARVYFSVCFNPLCPKSDATGFYIFLTFP